MTNAAPRRASRPLTPRPRRPSRAAAAAARGSGAAASAVASVVSLVFSKETPPSGRPDPALPLAPPAVARASASASSRARSDAPFAPPSRASLTESLTVRESFGASDVRSEGSALLRPALVKASPRSSSAVSRSGRIGGHAVFAVADPPASRRVYMRAVLQYAMSSRARSMFPASQFRGLSGSGLQSSASTARHTECRVHAGDHASFRMSRQISPVFQCTFGWKIFVSNAARGGASGYDSGSEKRTTNVPVSNGVSSGPFSVALHRKRFSPSGARRMVASASRAASLISFSRRERLDMAPRARPPVAGTRVT